MTITEVSEKYDLSQDTLVVTVTLTYSRSGTSADE